MGRMSDPFSVWVFRCWFESGGWSSFKVCAACEYDAWRIAELILGVRVE